MCIKDHINSNGFIDTEKPVGVESLQLRKGGYEVDTQVDILHLSLYGGHKSLWWLLISIKVSLDLNTNWLQLRVSLDG